MPILTRAQFYYRVRKRLGRCVRCAKLNDRHPTHVACSACAAIASRWRYGPHPEGAVTRCKDCARVFEGNGRICPPCRKKRRDYKRYRRAIGVPHDRA